MRALRLLVSTLALLLLAGCGSIEFRLPGHTAQQHTSAVRLAVGEHRPALATPARLPVPGGFWLGLVSEEPAIVGIETVDTSRGASTVTLVGRRAGVTTVHYVNRFAVPAGAPLAAEELRSRSLGAFTVQVR